MCESYAKPGEVYISKEAAELIQNEAKFVNTKGKKTVCYIYNSFRQL
jgi:hypothetical protein